MMKPKYIFLFAVCFGVTACGAGKAKRVEEADLHYQMAQRLIKKDETVQAMSEALQAAELDPEHAEYQNLLGLLFVQRGNRAKAETYFRESVRLDPKYSEGHNHLCAVLIEKGEYDDAIDHCTQAASKVTYGTPERAYHNMGRAHEQKGETSLAVAAYKKALLHNKNFVMSLRALGEIHLKRKELKKAISSLESARKVCKASPAGIWRLECPASFYQLALAYVQLRNRKKAVVAFQECVQADEKGTYAAKCRRNLKLYR